MANKLENTHVKILFHKTHFYFIFQLRKPVSDSGTKSTGRKLSQVEFSE